MYYKVCAREGTGLVSTVVRRHAKVSYAIGQVSTPPPWLESRGYGLLVFATLEQAREWARVQGDGCAVFACTVGKVVPLPPHCCVFRAGFKRELVPTLVPWPAGTVMVTSLTLEKEV